MEQTMTLSHDEELASLLVLQKAISERVNFLKGENKTNMERNNAETGADRKAFTLGGVKVGSATWVPAKTQPSIIPGREDEAIAFLESVGLTNRQPVKGWESMFINVGGNCVFEYTGEMCDAIVFDVVRAPYVSYSIKSEDVLKGWQARGINTADVVALLEGGSDE